MDQLSDGELRGRIARGFVEQEKECCWKMTSRRLPVAFPIFRIAVPVPFHPGYDRIGLYLFLDFCYTLRYLSVARLSADISGDTNGIIKYFSQEDTA